MEDSSLDFLDKLVPSAAKEDPEVAPNPRRGASSAGRSLAPPPPSVLAAVRQGAGELDIEVDLSESAPHHAVPVHGGSQQDGSQGGSQQAGSQHHSPEHEGPAETSVSDKGLMPWMNDAQRAPSSRPGPGSDSVRRIPLPHEAALIAEPKRSTAAEDAAPASPSVSSVAPPRAVSAPPAPSMRAASAPPAPPRRQEAAVDSAADKPAPELFADLAAPARKSAGPPPPPSLRASGGPPPPPRPKSDPQAVAAQAADDASNAERWDDDSLVSRPEPELATVPLTAPTFLAAAAPAAAVGSSAAQAAAVANVPSVIVSPNVWSVDSVLPDPPSFPAAHSLAETGPSKAAQSLPAPPSAAIGSPSSLPPPAPLTGGVSTTLPPLPPPPTSIAPAAQVDSASEWDEAPTAIYARDGLHSLPPGLHSVPPERGPLPKATLPPMPTVPSVRAPGRNALLQAQVQAQLQQHAKWLIPAAAALLGLLLLAIWPKGEREGELVVNIAGPSGVAVDGVKIYLDNVLTCEDSPCQLKRLAVRSHVVTAEAPGYSKTAPTAVLVKEDETTIHTIELLRAPAPETEQVAARRAEPAAAPSKAVLKLVAGTNTEGADIRLDGKPIRLPLTVELDPGATHQLHATRAGFEPVSEQLKFASASEHQVTINLEPEAEGTVSEETAEVAAEDPIASSRGSRSKSAGGSAAVRAKPSPKATAGGTAKLTLLSVPPAVVILDGKPIGKSPKRAVTVSAGNHNIVFVHPTKGRKRASAKVAAGSSKTIAVKF